MDLLTKLKIQEGKTIIMVTHEPEIAACSSCRIVIRDGVISSDISWKGGPNKIEICNQLDYEP